MLSHLRPAMVLLVLFTLLTGLLYPLAITALGQALFPRQANGSLIEQDDRIIGSALIGQGFAAPQYFWPRPSAAGKEGYDATASGGSNLAPTAQALVARSGQDVADYQATNGAGSVPGDAVTTSGSGLDPHISPANARRQMARVAATRRMAISELAPLVEQHTERPWPAFLGKPGVNVLTLNLALDKVRPFRQQ